MPTKKKTTTKKKKEEKDTSVRTGTVNCYLLNIRKEPKPNAELAGLLKKDEVVTIDTSFDDKLWYKIEQGYVKKAFIDLFVI